MSSFLLAFGVHLNILCVIAQLVLMRPALMECPSYVTSWISLNQLTSRPMKILRTFPPLQARIIISITVALVKDVPEELYRELVAHPFTV
jgi:cell cycle arrest protein BUB2